MKEFMAFIYTEGDHMAEMSPEEQQQHVEKVGAYIQGLMQSGKMKGAQPLELSGITISGTQGNLQDAPFNETKEVIGGYYHLAGESLEEVADLIRKDPRFEDGPWKVEIRPIRVVQGIN
ncbi:hypothetical protein BFP97_03610 [Roseivirga sp. 4D4]|uniref:YciI family protein n=1 Tax=Roseivirga sp. 4D4 TaxID=1889784 RepID=UPI000852CF7D|nr:YciI family protein [Roseivirga sp. 4D4]OEK00647.1 hypothetical protein BFP97_03610 [Roseivirga sp. 4D4]